MIYTPNQQEALDYRNGNLLIIACAGSGKTQVLSRRIALLISEGVPRESIVAFTFTDLAAAELKSRIRREMASLRAEGRLDNASLGEMYIGTIHSFSLRLLKEINATYRNFDIIDEKRQAAIIVSQFRNLGLDRLQGTNYSKIETIRRFIETLNIVYREHLDIYALSNPDLADSIRKYHDYVKQRPNCFLSFDEIIAELVSTISENEPICERVQHRFSNIFVDEYQDIDDQQEKLIRLLSDTGTTAHVCAVGDDDQAIYRFRGASITNILSFEQVYPSVRRITLSSNFRSTHAIVEIANTAVTGRRIGRKTIPGLNCRLVKSMEAMKFNSILGDFEETMAEHGDVWNCTFDNEENEASFVADKIQELIGLPWNNGEENRGLSYADMSILCRSVNYMRPIMNKLDQRNIPYVIKGAKGLFENTEIQAVHASFCLLFESKYVIPHPVKYNAYLSIDEAETRARIRHNIESLRDTGKMPNADWNALFAWVAQKRVLFQRMLDPAQRSKFHLRRRLFPQELFYEMLELLGANRNQWPESILYNLGRFSELILGFESVHQWVTPFDMRDFTYYLGYWATKEANDIRHQDLGTQNAIQISTIHQAKGLEWVVVFIPALTSRRLPSQRRNDGNGHLLSISECVGRPYASGNAAEERERVDEELRLWYVALTRSKKFLFISGLELPRIHTSPFAANIQHDYVSTDYTAMFDRPQRIDPVVPIDATILPTTFSDLRYYWECPRDYLLRRLMGFSPGVNESYGYGQQIHNMLAILHSSLPFNNIDDAWIEAQVDEHFNLRYTRGAPLEAMKAAAKRIIKIYFHSTPELREKVLHSEKQFEFIIEGAMISGTIDLLNRINPTIDDSHHVEVVDFKTCKTGDDLSAGERLASIQQQLQIYAIATRDALGLEPLRAIAHFLYANQPHERVQIPLNDAVTESMKQQIGRSVSSIKAGIFQMCEFTAAKCHNCDFKAICSGSQR
jgi:DNA helicase-2/ATP-dependent DNA helicase PcrA